MSYLAITHTVQDVITHVKRQFGDESGVQLLDDDIIRFINAGQDEIFRVIEPIKTTATADLVASQVDYTFPDNVLKVQSILVDNKPIQFKSYQEAQEYILSNDPNRIQTGSPLIWWEWGGTFTFWPTPDTSSVGGIKFHYIQAPTPVTMANDDLSVPDTYYNRLIEYVLAQAYELDEDWQAAQLKSNQFGQNMENQINENTVEYDTYPMITVLIDDM